MVSRFLTRGEFTRNYLEHSITLDRANTDPGKWLWSS